MKKRLDKIKDDKDPKKAFVQKTGDITPTDVKIKLDKIVNPEDYDEDTNNVSALENATRLAARGSSIEKSLSRCYRRRRTGNSGMLRTRLKCYAHQSRLSGCFGHGRELRVKSSMSSPTTRWIATSTSRMSSTRLRKRSLVSWQCWRSKNLSCSRRPVNRTRLLARLSLTTYNHCRRQRH